MDLRPLDAADNSMRLCHYRRAYSSTPARTIANRPSDTADDQLTDDFVRTKQFDTETAKAPGIVAEEILLKVLSNASADFAPRFLRSLSRYWAGSCRLMG